MRGTPEGLCARKFLTADGYEGVCEKFGLHEVCAGVVKIPWPPPETAPSASRNVVSGNPNGERQNG
jgi:hypothetical protein